jgi:xanthine dehydrogenase molybdenum-binding subunit
MNENFSFIEKSVPMAKKQNAFDKARGKAEYTVDLKLPGMLYAKILRSPYAHAKVIDIDASSAKKKRGVKAVLTGKDVSPKPYGILPPPYPQDMYTLPPIGGKVRYVGDPVAAVAAETLDAAEEALELIDVKYEELPAVFDPEEAIKPDAPKIHPWGNFVIPPTIVEFGNVEEGFREADYIFEGTYKTPIQCHVCLEPHACIASWDADGKLTVYTGTLGHHHTAHSLALALGIPIGNIRVVIPPGGMGGGFGSKAECRAANMDIAALLAKKTGRPVKLMFTREEEFTCTVTRHATITWLKTGVKKDGTLTARYSKSIYDTGAYADHGPLVFTRALRSLALWKCPNVKWEGLLVYTNKPVAGAFRGYGNPQHTFAVELQNDEIAETLGIDPLEWRLKNHIGVGDINIAPGKWASNKPLGGKNWQPQVEKIRSCGLSECILKGAAIIGWREKREKTKALQNKKIRGVGMACGMHATSGWPAPWISGAYVELSEKGKITLITGGTDHGGTGQHTVMAQICAEELGIPLENITVVAEDTEITPYDSGTAAASGGTFTVGIAVIRAIADLKKKLLDQAAAILKTRIDTLEFKKGVIRCKEDPKKEISLIEIANRSGKLRGEATLCESQSAAPPFFANFAEVEVDIETGEIRVLKIVAVHDSGTIINPMFFEGQVQGGIQQGLGYALTEALIIDNKNGVPLNPRLLDYNVLRASDMPDVEVAMVKTEEPLGPFGAKGLGEPCSVSVAPAVVNAICNAIGTRIREIPVTSEKIFRVVKEKYQRGKVSNFDLRCV